MKYIKTALVAALALPLLFTSAEAASSKTKKYDLKDVLSCNITSAEKKTINDNFDKFLKQNNIKKTNVAGKTINKNTALNMCLGAYGNPFDYAGDSPKYDKNGNRVYRYIGYNEQNQVITNPFFPNDFSIRYDYTKTSQFIKNPWTKKGSINTGRKPKVVWGDPRWTKSSQVKVNDPYRVAQLGRAVDNPYINYYNTLENPQKYFLGSNYYGKTPYLKSTGKKEDDGSVIYSGAYLSQFANVQTYQTRKFGGSFVLYRYYGGIYRYHTYSLPSDEPFLTPIKPDPETPTTPTKPTDPKNPTTPTKPKPVVLDDLYIDTNTFTVNPNNPEAGGKLTVSFVVGNMGNTSTVYKNIPLKFGWQETGNYWCVNVAKLGPKQKVKITLTSDQKTSCDGKTRSNFVFPKEGGTKKFYANINYIPSNPKKETTFANNVLSKPVTGKAPKDPKDSGVNCSKDSRFCITGYPKYPSTKSEGGNGAYYKVQYDFWKTGSDTEPVMPKIVDFTYTLKDPKGNVVVTGQYREKIPAKCLNGAAAATDKQCLESIVYIGNLSYVTDNIPSKKINFKNVGKHVLYLEAKEQRVRNGQDFDTITVRANLEVPVTGISTGISN